MATEVNTTGAPLKRLNFVADTLSSAQNIAGSTYKSARQYTPGFVEPYVSRAEETVVGYSAPVVNYAQDVGEKVLRTADGTIDQALGRSQAKLQGGVQGASDLHNKNLHKYNQARDEYYQFVENLLEWAKAKLSPYPYIAAAADTVKAVINKVWELTDPDVAVETVQEAWVRFSKIPLVAKLLEVNQPIVDLLYKQYYTVHEYLVTSPLYKKAVDTGLQVGTTVTGIVENNYFFKRGKAIFYPYVAPVADPVYERVQNSKYINQLVTHFKPKLHSA